MMNNYPLLPLLLCGDKNLTVCSVTDQHITISERWEEAVSEYFLFAVRKFWYTRLQTKLGIQPG